ncbi:MAG: PilT/PilU family type 4a pilus ATPase [Lachnospiraceae bacterium]|jgi:twitching motility protein PilT|nr:PilT/PilU family type 4a pilus ATPase [Lachnospiraceae bacterium]
MNIYDFLSQATKEEASDLFIVAGLPLSYKVNNTLHTFGEDRCTPDATDELIAQIYELAGKRSMEVLKARGDDDFSFAIPGLSRFRVSTYRQRGSLAAVIRVIVFQLPDPDELHIPPSIMRLGQYTKGLVLVTGPAGSGKSTTLACIIDQINETHEGHIITLEDPLEFLHRHKKSIVSQREVSSDTASYVAALRAALRQAPDVILLGEMRDYETINIAMTAAETGHLVISTLHTIGASSTIERIIDVFPPAQQHQITIQLASVLQAVASQQLIPTSDGTRIPAFELMTMTPAIRNMIRENKVHQIDGHIYSSATDTMFSMDTSLMKLCKEGTISRKDALHYASNPDMLAKKLPL